MEKGFSAHGSYSSSKLCNAMHCMELSERLKASMPHVTANTLDPGTVNTKVAKVTPSRKSTRTRKAGGKGN